MAEAAAAAVVAEQVVSTGVEAGAAASLAVPTQPLTVALSQIATTSEDDSLALARSHHSVTIIGDKAYIFGGQKEDGSLCTSDVHAVALPSDRPQNTEYACYPAVDVCPPPRTRHAACALNDGLVVNGGRDENGEALDEESGIWQWDTDTAKWSRVNAEGEAPEARYNHWIFPGDKEDTLIIHGGVVNGELAKDTWLFDFKTCTWTELPSASSSPMAAQFVNNTLITISADSDMNGTVNYLDLGKSEWSTVEFPTHPLHPGPRPRVGSALIPVTTGFGRRYLLYLLGSRQDVKVASSDKAFTDDHPFYSDIWSLQIPSNSYSASSLKDVIRDHLPGTNSGSFSWAEVEIAPIEPMQSEGKVHPGPRGFFGADVSSDGKSVIIWGGINAKGETESDGWLLKVS